MPATRNIYSARQSRRLSNQSPWLDLQPDFWPEYVSQMFAEAKPVPVLSDKFHDPPCPELTAATPHSSRQKSDGKIRRPRNAFIFYRSVFYKRIKSGAASIDQNHLSKQAGISWNSLSHAEQAPFHVMAEAEKNRYTVLYPDYKYSPGSSARSKPYSAKPKKSRAQSPVSSSRTRSTSVESDHHPTASSSRRRIVRPSRAAIASMAAVPVAISDDGNVAEPEPEIVQIKEPVKQEEAPVITQHLVESSPEHHFFHMSKEVVFVTQLNTPLPSSYYHIDEQFAFKAGVDIESQPTLSSLNSAVDVFDVLPLKKKKSKGKKKETSGTHSDWDLESMYEPQGLDMEFTPSVEHTSFLGMDFEPSIVR
ncbi:hypothetical protein C8J56DRAFT_1020457 [Mycena floridula]|nr:hypothetical protein C8J56DRAFT_1020457 [Mycena floridula]